MRALNEDRYDALHDVGMCLFEVVEHQQVGLTGQLRTIVLRLVNDLRQPRVAQLVQVVVVDGCVDAFGCQRRQRAGRVEVDHAKVALVELVARERIVSHQLEVRTAKDRHEVALKILDGVDIRIGRYRDLDAAAYAGGEQQVRFQAIGASQHGRQVALKREIEGLVRDRFVDGRAGALEEQPFDLDAILREILFEQLLELHGSGGGSTKRRWITVALLRDADADHSGFVGMSRDCCKRQRRNDQQVS